MSTSFSAVILAAGQGTRMKTPLPKVVHPVAGRPMVESVVRAARSAGAREIRVVVGYGENLVRAIVEPMGAICFKQAKQVGTADAVKSAQVDTLNGDVLILNGDHPLLEGEDLVNLRRQFSDSQAQLGLVTCEMADPGHFGRIVRHQGEVRAIVEYKDASAETRKIREVNTGIYLVRADVLAKLLPQIESRNAQGEFYLTDIVELAIDAGLKVTGLKADPRVALGVNTQAELAEATRQVFARKVERLMAAGVMCLDPKSTFVEETVEVGPAAILYPQVYLRGTTKIGGFTVVEPGCMIKDSVIGENVHVRSGCYLDQAQVGSQVLMGPYAHLRPGTVVADECHLGNFVELKKTKLGKGSKANHLTYLGDAEIGENTNIGCGTITCNYAVDRQKYVTKIGSNVFVGSDTQFIAPVTVGDGAVIGSGSTITKDVPSGSLAVARAKQIIKEDYSPKKKE